MVALVRTRWIEQAERVIVSRMSCEHFLTSARAASPFEICGLVAGLCASKTLLVARLYPVRNRSRVTNRFHIREHDRRVSRHIAWLLGLELLGTYHSHPFAPAHPSSTDQFLSPDEPMLWLIGSPAYREIRAYRSMGRNFHRICLEIVNTSKLLRLLKGASGRRSVRPFRVPPQA